MRKATTVAAAVIVLYCSTAFSAQDDVRAYQSAADNYYAFKNSPDKQKYHHHWDNLIRQFRRVAEGYPDSSKADDAWYMIGILALECYEKSFLNSDLDTALAAFEKLAVDYPQSNLADDGRFWRGEIYLKKGDTAAARQEYMLLLKDFPNGDMAGKARARLKELPQPIAPQPTQPAVRVEDAPKDRREHPEPQPETPQKSSLTPVLQEIARSVKEEESKEELHEDTDAAADPQQKEAGSAQESPTISKEKDTEQPRDSTGPGSLPANADYAQLFSIRFRSVEGYTRIVVDLDREVPYMKPHLLRSDPALKTPPRMYVDFQSAVLSDKLKEQMPYLNGCYDLPIRDGLLLKVRAGQYQKDVARVVLDIDSIETYRAFPLKSEEGHYRYVIDVFGQKQKRPEPVLSGEPVAGPAPLAGAGPAAKTVIVIDPGHGGKDPGAIGPSGVREKDVTLEMAKRLKRELEQENSDVKVVLTRDSDKYVSLVYRTSMANELNAALFISLHCNWAKNKQATGIETYYLDNTSDKAALRLAAKENFVSEEVSKDAGDTTNQILADLIQKTKVDDSIPLARYIQSSLVKSLRSHYGDITDRGVKKAPFWVLVGATMPCVLVEVSFISNPKEERRLQSAAYQTHAAKAMAKGIDKYLQEYPPISLAAGE